MKVHFDYVRNGELHEERSSACFASVWGALPARVPEVTIWMPYNPETDLIGEYEADGVACPGMKVDDVKFIFAELDKIGLKSTWLSEEKVLQIPSRRYGPLVDTRCKGLRIDTTQNSVIGTRILYNTWRMIAENYGETYKIGQALLRFLRGKSKAPTYQKLLVAQFALRSGNNHTMRFYDSALYSLGTQELFDQFIVRSTSKLFYTKDYFTHEDGYLTRNTSYEDMGTLVSAVNDKRKSFATVLKLYKLLELKYTLKGNT